LRSHSACHPTIKAIIVICKRLGVGVSGDAARKGVWRVGIIVWNFRRTSSTHHLACGSVKIGLKQPITDRAGGFLSSAVAIACEILFLLGGALNLGCFGATNEFVGGEFALTRTISRAA